MISNRIADFLDKNRFINKLQPKVVLWILFSLAFYASSSFKLVFFLVIYIVLVYLLGKVVTYLKNKDKKKVYLAIIIIIPLAILYFYKYSAFTINVLNSILGTKISGYGKFMIPLGISFITFSAISYIVDVYRGDKDSGSFLEVFLYLSFFPKVISGPVVLWKNFEIKNKKVDSEIYLKGLNRIMIGFAKKVLIADFFAVKTDFIVRIFSSGIDAPTAWLFTILYTLRIYYDFSGYSDIAIGISNLLGYDFKANFNYPYSSTSISEFWRRWHISLGSWFREYVYVPMGGSRVSDKRLFVNIFTVFLLTGIWHGAGYHYILWGIAHGLLVIIEKLFLFKSKIYKKIPSLVKWIVIVFIINISWLPFSLRSLSEIKSFIYTMFGLIKHKNIIFTFDYFMSTKLLIFMIIATIGSFIFRFIKINDNSKALFILKQTIIIIIFILAILGIYNSNYSPFIYFQY